MKTKITIMGLLCIVLSFGAAFGEESKNITVKNGVRTVNKLNFPSLINKDKKELNICWRGKLCWVDGHWERQIVLYNGSAKPPLDHPIYDYVKSLPAPDYKGEEKYESIYPEEFECGNSTKIYDFRPQYDITNKKEVKKGEGSSPNTGNRNNDREVAKNAALRDIVEQFGVKVDSETKIVNLQVASDIIKTKANKKVQFVPAVEQYHIKDGQNEYQVIIWGWLDE